MLVLLDNASAEYTFLVRFFSRPPPPPRAAPSGLAPEGPDRRQRLMSETPSEWGGAAGSDGYAAGGGLERRESSIAGDRRESSFHGPGMERRESSWMRRESSFTAGSAAGSGGVLEKDEKTEMEGLWHSVFDPALTYCQVRCLSSRTSRHCHWTRAHPRPFLNESRPSSPPSSPPPLHRRSPPFSP